MDARPDAVSSICESFFLACRALVVLALYTSSAGLIALLWINFYLQIQLDGEIFTAPEVINNYRISKYNIGDDIDNIEFFCEFAKELGRANDPPKDKRSEMQVRQRPPPAESPARAI